MNEFLLHVAIFCCGGCVGFMVAAFFIAGARADDTDEFDGGFSVSNHPPVRTKIWHGSVDEGQP